MAPPGGDLDARSRLAFGHPRSLLTLASLEMWERFSFYGLDVILAYYLYFSLSDGGLGLSQGIALSVTGAYGGTIYAAQILGAWLADRVISPRKLALIGAIGIMCGHLCLAIFQDLPGFIIGLGFIVLGTAGLKVNTTRMVGDLYSLTNPRRDAGYTIYYMGISIGAFLGPVITGALYESINFHTAFAAAAVGMAIGLVIYLLGWNRLPEATKIVANPLPREKYGRALLIAVLVIVVLVLLTAVGWLTLDTMSNYVLAIVVVASIGYFVALIRSKKSTTAHERQNVIGYIPVFIGTLIFWALLLQLFTTFAVYLDERVDLSIGSFDIPAPWLITAEGVINAVLGPIIATVWIRMGKRQPSPLTKICLGLVVLALAFVLFATMSGSQGQTNNVIVVTIGFALFALAEIIVAPTAMSATQKYAPQAYTSQLMALYFLTMSGGATLSGLLAGLYTGAHEGAFFLTTALITVVLSAGLLMLGRILQPAAELSSNEGTS